MVKGRTPDGLAQTSYCTCCKAEDLPDRNISGAIAGQTQELDYKSNLELGNV